MTHRLHCRWETGVPRDGRVVLVLFHTATALVTFAGTCPYVSRGLVGPRATPRDDSREPLPMWGPYNSPSVRLLVCTIYVGTRRLAPGEPVDRG